jgi:hypothetical protein
VDYLRYFAEWRIAIKMVGGYVFFFMVLSATSSMALLLPRPNRPQLRSLSAATVIIDTSNNLALGMGAVGIASALAAVKDGNGVKIAPSLVAALTLFLTNYLHTKTESSRFKFTDEAFSIVRADGSSIGDNPVMGGSYEWPFSNIVEYKVFPNERLPILLYFKENKTPADQCVAAPVSISTSPGQVHIFPIIGNADQLRTNLQLHNVRVVDKPHWTVESNPVLFVKGLTLI